MDPTRHIIPNHTMRFSVSTLALIFTFVSAALAAPSAEPLLSGHCVCVTDPCPCAAN